MYKIFFYSLLFLTIFVGATSQAVAVTEESEATVEQTVSIVPIPAVSEIPADLIDGATVVVVDGDETVSRPTIMANTWEYGRQHRDAMMAAGLVVYRDIYPAECAGLTDAEILVSDRFCTKRPALEKRIDQVLDGAPRSYELTEDHWPTFLAEARNAGAKTIVVSSRKFFGAGRGDKDPERVPFFERLGFAQGDLLYSGSADGCRKDVTIHHWLEENKVLGISRVVFVDNLREHCSEIMESPVLENVTCHAFEHNAFAQYFAEHHHVLVRQMREALKGSAFTDTQIKEMLAKEMDENLEG